MVDNLGALFRKAFEEAYWAAFSTELGWDALWTIHHRLYGPQFSGPVHPARIAHALEVLSRG